jgi:hypothetical protein
MMKLALVGFALVISGCATQRFEVQGSSQQAPSLDDAQTFFVAGIGQSKEVDAAKVCGGAKNVQSIETQLTPGNIALSFVTFGIYTPRQMRVYCTR